MATILFLHGFGTIGACDLSVALAEAFPDARVAAPNLPPDPRAALDLAQAVVRRCGQAGEFDLYLVGISLGGFYAHVLSTCFGIPATLVNPAFDAHTRVAGLVGDHRNYVTGEPFTFARGYLDSLAGMAALIAEEGDPALVQALVALDDEIIPAAESLAHYQAMGVAVTTFADKGHRFEDVQALIPAIARHRARFARAAADDRRDGPSDPEPTAAPGVRR